MVTIWVSGRSGAPPPVRLMVEGGPDTPFTLAWQELAVPPGSGVPIGILTLSGLQPGTRYRAQVGDGANAWDLRPKTLPAALPESGLTFFVGSCYYRDQDEGQVLAALRDVPEPRPVFKLLVGDQVYADWPPIGLLPFANLGRAYLARYQEYWNYLPYRDFLSESPNFFTCDDHEWWNNAPEFQYHLPQTWTDGRRQASLAGARQAYGLYQVRPNASGGFWSTFDIPPVSFFIADTRSDRSLFADEPRRLYSPGQATALADWARQLTGPGFLVLGQPLFGKEGDWKDYNLRDFTEDYRDLWDIIELAPHRIAILTGDIHVGRLAVSPGAMGIPGRPPIFELTSSPLALVGGSGQGGVGAPESITIEGGLQRGLSREVRTLFGTREANFALVRLAPAARPRPAVRVDFELWSIPRRRLAIDEATGRPCSWTEVLD
jgi:hypothetical protein